MEVAFGYRAPLPKNEEAPTVIAFLPNSAGYAWAFPRLNHVSFGIATSQNVFNHGALDLLLWDFIAGYYLKAGDKLAGIWTTRKRSKNGQLRFDVIENLRPVVDRYAARIPGLSPETLASRRAAGDGWALLGDAAGFADPVTGEGIYYALRSAEIFADAFINDQSSNYETMWRDDFGRELYRAAEMRRRFYGSLAGAPFTDRMISLARMHSGIRQTLRELVTGDQGYVDLKCVLARRAVWPL
jgi:flavin-dependent dehydrogenase